MSDFYGLPTHTLQNKNLRLDILAAGALRIARLLPYGSDRNLLAEEPDFRLPGPYGEYHLWGGHRLWAAPENPDITYVPDPKELTIQAIENGLQIDAPTEKPTNLRKSIRVTIDPEKPIVKLIHTICNDGNATIELAAWALSALTLGGTVILPQSCAPTSSKRFQPNRHIALWSYTSWHDPRLKIDDSFIKLQASPALPPCKIGYFNTNGWIGYLSGKILFVKRFDVFADQAHADRGCNVEIYCNDRFVEIETLSPLKTLAPGAKAVHTENWEVYPSAKAPSICGTIAD